MNRTITASLAILTTAFVLSACGEKAESPAPAAAPTAAAPAPAPAPADGTAAPAEATPPASGGDKDASQGGGNKL